MIQTITEMGQALSLPQPGIPEWDMLDDPTRAEALIRSMDPNRQERIVTGLQELAERYGWCGLNPPDVVNEVYSRKLRSLVLSLWTVEPTRRPAYLRALVRNTIHEMHRFNIGRAGQLTREVLAELGVYHNDPESLNNESRAYIMSLGMRALGPNVDREKAIRLFVLHHLDGHSIDEVAAMEGMTPGAVRRSVHRTLTAIRRLIKEIDDS
jgi:DNA-directed RNA polymerase specialized sigma24 family protein